LSTFSFQQPQATALFNFDKKRKILDSEQLTLPSDTDTQTFDITALSEIRTPRVTGQWDCVVCCKPFPTKFQLNQDKNSTYHKNNV
jgi:hypothetical protein